MSEEKHETQAEIIAEMRFHAQQNIDAEKGSPTFGILSMEGQIARDYADRAEAAHKREVDALTTKLEVAKHCWKVWSDRADELKNKCNEQYAKLKTVGNVAKLREAAKYVQSTMEGLRDPTDKNNAEFIRIWEIVSAALAAPPRNCDVGTAEEQAQRFSRFCDANKYVGDDGTNWCSPTCPCYNIIDCGVKWAQMPYEEGGNDADK